MKLPVIVSIACMNTALIFAVDDQAETIDSSERPSAVKATPVLDSTITASPTKGKKSEIVSPTKASTVKRSAAPLDQKGKIEKIDVAENAIVVEGKTFTLSKHGKVFIDNTKKSLNDLKEGDLVAVVYYAQADGTNRATRIIKGYPHKKKKSKAE